MNQKNSKKTDAPLVVRIDGRHLVGNAVLLSVTGALEKTGLAAHLLELDVLAPNSLVDGAALTESLWQLHRLGVRLSLSASPLSAMPLLQLSQLPLTALTLPEPLWRRSMEDKRTLASDCSRELGRLATKRGPTAQATPIGSHSMTGAAL